MPHIYYDKLYDIGGGKKFGMLYVDSCLILCLEQDHDYNFCYYNSTEWGKTQYEWIDQKIEEWSKDPSIIWKGTILHHTLFGKHYTDYEQIIADYLPRLVKGGFDVYLNGHEHTLDYVYYPIKSSALSHHTHDDDCHHNIEDFFGHNMRYSHFEKGEALHQITTGGTGRDPYTLCPAKETKGVFRYMQNILNGYSKVYVDEKVFRVDIMGAEVDELTGEVENKLLYTIEITNPDAGNEEDII